MKARDIMTRDVITVKPDLPIIDFCRLIHEKHIAGVPVVDDDGDLVGICTEKDVIIATVLSEDVEVFSGEFKQLFTGDKSSIHDRFLPSHYSTVGEIMTRDPTVAYPDESMQHIAEHMIDEHCHRLPIVEGKKVVGIISTHDIIRLVAAGELSNAEAESD